MISLCGGKFSRGKMTLFLVLIVIYIIVSSLITTFHINTEMKDVMGTDFQRERIEYTPQTYTDDNNTTTTTTTNNNNNNARLGMMKLSASLETGISSKNSLKNDNKQINNMMIKMKKKNDDDDDDDDDRSGGNDNNYNNNNNENENMIELQMKNGKKVMVHLSKDSKNKDIDFNQIDFMETKKFKQAKRRLKTKYDAPVICSVFNSSKYFADRRKIEFYKIDNINDNWDKKLMAMQDVKKKQNHNQNQNDRENDNNNNNDALKNNYIPRDKKTNTISTTMMDRDRDMDRDEKIYPFYNTKYGCKSEIQQFLVIGTQKGGTTQLYDHFVKHPDIYFSVNKELHYFDAKAITDLRYIDYVTKFPLLTQQRWSQIDDNNPLYDDPQDLVQKQNKVTEKTKGQKINYMEKEIKSRCDKKYNLAIGDATPKYMNTPTVPSKIINLIPMSQSLKIFASLRDPIGRALSHWNFGPSPYRSFEETVDYEISHVNHCLGKFVFAKEEEDTRGGEYLMKNIGLNALMKWKEVTGKSKRNDKDYKCHCDGYLTRGLYYFQLLNWFYYFKKENFMIVQAETFFQNSNDIMMLFYQFLNVRPIENIIEEQIHNNGNITEKFGGQTKRQEHFKRIMRTKHNEDIINANLDDILIDVNNIDEKVLQKLCDFYKPYNQLLYDLMNFIDVEFKPWNKYCK